MLIKCVECEDNISSTTGTCPSCGCAEPFRGYENCTYCNHKFLPVLKEALLKPKELENWAKYVKRTPTNEHCPCCKCPDPFNTENEKYKGVLKELTEEYDSKFPKLGHVFGQCKCGYGKFSHHPLRASYRGSLNSLNIIIISILTVLIMMLFILDSEIKYKETIEYLSYFGTSLLSAIFVWFGYLFFQRKIIASVLDDFSFTYRNEIFDFFGKERMAVYGEYILGNNYNKFPNILFNEKVTTKCPSCEIEKIYIKKVFSNKGKFKEVD